MSFLWILPKGCPEDLVWELKNTRPLSGANADAKIFAKYIALSFEAKLDQWAFAYQRGFIKGRNMLQNIIGLNSFAAMMARNPQSCPAIILLDLAAAFPSLARAFIWITLEAIGIPNFVIRAIHSLYS